MPVTQSLKIFRLDSRLNNKSARSARGSERAAVNRSFKRSLRSIKVRLSAPALSTTCCGYKAKRQSKRSAKCNYRSRTMFVRLQPLNV